MQSQRAEIQRPKEKEKTRTSSKISLNQLMQSGQVKSTVNGEKILGKKLLIFLVLSCNEFIV